jgi:hypothetical protein
VLRALGNLTITWALRQRPRVRGAASRRAI